MPRLEWDGDGDRLYETGVRQGVLYPRDSDGKYSKGYAWNGLTSVSESPSGAESNPIWADDIKYLNLISREDFGASIEAYTYPDQWAECDGSAALMDGVYIGQQKRKTFGLCYRTTIGNDIDGDAYGYKLHLIYGATAAPSERQYSTMNDSPEAMTMSWELSTIPVNVSGHQPTACLTIDSTKFTTEEQKGHLKDLEDALYGTNPDPDVSVDTGSDPWLPLPNDVFAILSGTYDPDDEDEEEEEEDSTP